MTQREMMIHESRAVKSLLDIARKYYKEEDYGKNKSCFGADPERDDESRRIPGGSSACSVLCE